jgi:hypothetical protein
MSTEFQSEPECPESLVTPIHRDADSRTGLVCRQTGFFPVAVPKEASMSSDSEKTATNPFGQIFASGATNGKHQRSRTGLLLALVLLPLLLGVLACLPVPVGDPEKSHVDASLTGAWRVVAADDEQMLLVLDPYDKRTWLMTLIGLEATGHDAADMDESGQATQAAPFSAANADAFKVEGVGVYKAWLTRIKGETFMTWESKTLSETLPKMAPDSWWVFRVRKSGDDQFYLDSFDYSVDGLDEAGTREEAENIIRRHLADPGFFREQDAPRIERLSAEDIAALPRLLKEFGITDSL